MDAPDIGRNVPTGYSDETGINLNDVRPSQ